MRREDGFTLVELLIAAALMIVILLATLAVFDGFIATDHRAQNQNDSQAAARNATDQLARELRNVANPGQPSALERAAATDLVFDTVDPNGPDGGSNTNSVIRVRYCLDSSVATNERIWREWQTWTTASAPPLPGTTTCPDFSWNHTPHVVVDHVSNTSSQPLFSYNSTTLSSISQVITDVYVDQQPGSAPGPVELRTSVALRAVAQPPTASFTATPLGNDQVLLNAGASGDPQGQSLTYQWYDGSTPIGTAATLNYSAPTTGSHTFQLTVTNTSGLSASATQTVAVT